MKGVFMVEVLFFQGELKLGENVKVNRVARGWRQQDLAQQAKVAQTDVSRLERGQKVRPGAEKRILLALGLLEVAIDHYSRLVAYGWHRTLAKC
jgi:transcriptional regulator with XRE-family HTH domain